MIRNGRARSSSEVLTSVEQVAAGVRASRTRNSSSALPAASTLVAALASLRELREELAGWEPELITAAREQGVSWALLAPALGVGSRQAAERRYLRLRSTEGEELTGESRVEVTRDRRAGERAVAQWARENAAMLRQLAGQVSALADLEADGRSQAAKLHIALAHNDPARLISLLSAMRAHVGHHPALAERIVAITEQVAGRREAMVTMRQATRVTKRPK